MSKYEQFKYYQTLQITFDYILSLIFRVWFYVL